MLYSLLNIEFVILILSESTISLVDSDNINITNSIFNNEYSIPNDEFSNYIYQSNDIKFEDVSFKTDQSIQNILFMLNHSEDVIVDNIKTEYSNQFINATFCNNLYIQNNDIYDMILRFYDIDNLNILRNFINGDISFDSLIINQSNGVLIEQNNLLSGNILLGVYNTDSVIIRHNEFKNGYIGLKLKNCLNNINIRNNLFGYKSIPLYKNFNHIHIDGCNPMLFIYNTFYKPLDTDNLGTPQIDGYVEFVGSASFISSWLLNYFEDGSTSTLNGYTSNVGFLIRVVVTDEIDATPIIYPLDESRVISLEENQTMYYNNQIDQKARFLIISGNSTGITQIFDSNSVIYLDDHDVNQFEMFYQEIILFAINDIQNYTTYASYNDISVEHIISIINDDPIIEYTINDADKSITIDITDISHDKLYIYINGELIETLENEENTFNY
jgi:hypothetical protein